MFSPVLDLHQVTDKTIAGTALDKVLLGGQKPLAVHLTKLLDKVHFE